MRWSGPAGALTHFFSPESNPEASWEWPGSSSSHQNPLPAWSKLSRSNSVSSQKPEENPRVGEMSLCLNGWGWQVTPHPCLSLPASFSPTENSYPSSGDCQKFQNSWEIIKGTLKTWQICSETSHPLDSNASGFCLGKMPRSLFFSALSFHLASGLGTIPVVAIEVEIWTWGERQWSLTWQA